ncbi:MAG TPA: sulfite exporter TauE/SafE family protein [Thioalkalivibrio sp.]|nr:sulfite exporter TauE/SafE family protein [Thioalkalivibrio sp.]
MPEVIILYLLLGAIVGVIAGLLGIGGGLLIVPVLTWLFLDTGLLPEDTVQYAVGTSLATIVFTSLSSIRAHHLRGAVRWDIVARLVPGIVIGTLGGALLATVIASSTLGVIFGVFEILIALYMAADLKPSPARRLPATAGMTTAGSGIGAVSALLGIGGGTLTVPFLVWCNVVMREAVATASACGLPIAVAGTAGFVVFGMSSTPAAGATGYVYWPAVAGIVAASVFTAPLGAALAHRLPARHLKRLFSVVLLVLGIRMLLT